MKIAVIMGTYRKNGSGAGYVGQLGKALKGLPGVELEYVWLGDYNLSLCRGCMLCYDRGEAACSLKDGYLEAIARLNEADAAIFYSPTYTLSISGLMKTFFDRSSYVLHRPYFKGRRALVLTATAAWGERSAIRTLRTIVTMMGFSVAGELAVVNARYESVPKYRNKINLTLTKMAKRLATAAQSDKPIKPSIPELVAFRFQKSAFGTDTDGCKNDKLYWRQAGWAAPETKFYCQARISPVKAIIAKWLAEIMRKSRLVV